MNLSGMYRKSARRGKNPDFSSLSHEEASRQQTDDCLHITPGIEGAVTTTGAARRLTPVIDQALGNKGEASAQPRGKSRLKIIDQDNHFASMLSRRMEKYAIEAAYLSIVDSDDEQVGGPQPASQEEGRRRSRRSRRRRSPKDADNQASSPLQSDLPGLPSAAIAGASAGTKHGSPKHGTRVPPSPLGRATPDKLGRTTPDRDASPKHGHSGGRTGHSTPLDESAPLGSLPVALQHGNPGGGTKVARREEPLRSVQATTATTSAPAPAAPAAPRPEPQRGRGRHQPQLWAVRRTNPQGALATGPTSYAISMARPTIDRTGLRRPHSLERTQAPSRPESSCGSVTGRAERPGRPQSSCSTRSNGHAVPAVLMGESCLESLDKIERDRMFVQDD
eukprot:gnl/TRDRNA2_/TRDRNA2_44130_c0_seq1.p1 gnl/TRDRNA2_/TRDRNA2_44130_c0~~gnl/TRDRNA2_/TRDRNA2_44130_c0_seq1.p1  ORF type:complete len:392 (+),score=47.87 gnl/TRDRNA2_/TRDRNA2_44130_c0_seq1:215-1390(+)